MNSSPSSASMFTWINSGPRTTIKPLIGVKSMKIRGGLCIAMPITEIRQVLSACQPFLLFTNIRVAVITPTPCKYVAVFRG